MGLINGKRWDRIHSEFRPTFMHQAVSDTGSRVQKLALEYIEGLSRGDASIEVHASDFAQYPFFVTARFIYGPMTDEEKARLWKISNKALLLMRYVLKGGIYRFRAAQYIDGVMHKELSMFQKEWLGFNNDMHSSRCRWAVQTPIVSAWEHTLSGEISQKEVIPEFHGSQLHASELTN